MQALVVELGRAYNTKAARTALEWLDVPQDDTTLPMAVLEPPEAQMQAQSVKWYYLLADGGVELCCSPDAEARCFNDTHQFPEPWLAGAPLRCTGRAAQDSACAAAALVHSGLHA